jgi:hypothetical protein
MWPSTTALDVDNEDVRDVVVLAHPAAYISGHIVADSAATAKLNPSGVHVTVEVGDDGGVRVSGGPPVAADGTFGGETASGDVRIVADRLPAGWMVRRVVVDGIETTGRARFGDGAQHRVDIVLTDRLTHVVGRVVDKDGRTIPDARVAILSDDGAQSSTGRPQLRSVPARRDGTFAVDGLMPADYLAADVTGLEPIDLLDPVVIARVSRSATRFRVNDNQTVSIRIVGGER